MNTFLSEEKIPSFTGITCDSRKVKPGDAFVAISGFEEDGNKYIDEAINNGARVIFTEKPVKSEKARIVRVNDSRKTLGKLTSKFYNHPSYKFNVIGVTGTNGKTTTTHLIYHLLNYKKKVSGLIGTVNIDTGDKIKEGNLTTPAPVLLQKTLNKMVENNLKYCCMEVSSHGIKLQRITGTKFAVKVGTNITVDHFDLHSNLSEYRKVKKSFLTDDTSDTLVLINEDDPYFNKISPIAKKQVNLGINNKSTVRAEDINYNGTRTNFIYHLTESLVNDTELISPCQFPVQMLLPGKHNIYNALIAITIGLYYGLSSPLIREFFTIYTGVWRRLQVIHNDNFTIIDDCAHNPGSYKAVFRAIENLSYSRVFIVNSLRGNRGVKINRANARTISKHLNKMENYHLLTSNCIDVVKPIDKVSAAEEKAFIDILNKTNIKYTHYQQLKPALETIIKEVEEGDLVLLLGPHAMDQAGDIILKML